MAAKRRVVDIPKAQQQALTFAREWLSNHALGLGEMPEAQFTAVMHAVTSGLIAAYAQGYMEGVEQK